MRLAYLATANSDDIMTAIDVAYERTGRPVDRLRASPDTIRDIARDELRSPHEILCLVGIPFEQSPDVPRGVVEVTWRRRRA